MVEWYRGEPEIESRKVYPVREVWKCPKSDCDGEMEFNGASWPTADPGYHHTCTKCGYTAAIHGKGFPRINYKEEA